MKCGDCGLEFCDPMPTEKELAAFYASYNDPRAGEEVLRLNAERNMEALKKHGLSRDSALLDFGSGRAVFCQVGGSRHWHSYDAHTRDCDNTLLQPERYDWITTWGVLEHIPNPMQLLADFRRWLRPGGRLALTTVWTEAKIPYQYKPPEHVTYWPKRAMQCLMEKNGFVLEEFRPYVMKQSNEVYLNAVLRTVPPELRKLIHHDLPAFVEVPTNEVFVVARRG